MIMKKEPPLTEKEKKILETFEKVLPKLGDFEKGRLLGYGERMAVETNNKKAG